MTGLCTREDSFGLNILYDFPVSRYEVPPHLNLGKEQKEIFEPDTQEDPGTRASSGLPSSNSDYLASRVALHPEKKS
jgi:hypothetical protein